MRNDFMIRSHYAVVCSGMQRVTCLRCPNGAESSRAFPSLSKTPGYQAAVVCAILLTASGLPAQQASQVQHAKASSLPSSCSQNPKLILGGKLPKQGLVSSVEEWATSPHDQFPELENKSRRKKRSKTPSRGFHSPYVSVRQSATPSGGWQSWHGVSFGFSGHGLAPRPTHCVCFLFCALG